MGKWNKAPPQISEEFLQNEQRRKHMIIQAAKRRKQKQKKMQQQVQIERKNEQQALLKHKQQKKDAYVKHLRNNMHDKYEEMKRNQKLSQPQVRTKSKWKKDTLDSNSQIKGENNLQGLDLQVNIPNKIKVASSKIINKVGGQVVRNIPTAKQQLRKHQQNAWNYQKTTNQKLPFNKQSQKRRMLQDEFENMWNQEHDEEQKQIDYDLSVQETIFDDMLGSKLLDSLDLDLNTVSRGKKLDRKIKQQKKKQSIPQQNNQIDQIKNMIGYESVLVSIDDKSQMMKKYNQVMKNQVQPDPPLTQAELPNTKGFIKKKTEKHPKTTNHQLAQKPSKNLNEGEVFNQLKNKKEGKILNWAQDEVQEADDLFSNCSTNKKSKTRGFELLKQINKQIQFKNNKPATNSGTPNTSLNYRQVNMKKRQKPLETIPEKKINSSLQRLRERSFDKKPSEYQRKSTNLVSGNKNRSQQIKRSVSREKVQVSKPCHNRLNSAQNRSNPPSYPPHNPSRERVNKTATNSFKETSDNSGSVNMTQQRSRIDSRRSLSKQKQGSRSSKQIANYGQGYGKKPPLKIQQTISSARQAQIPVPSNNAAKKLAHFPPPYQRPINNGDQITIATQDQIFEVQSFIRNELLSLNRQQRQIQEELKNIHVECKEKLKEVEKKYQIKTDYKHSYELRQNEEGVYNQEDEDNRTNDSYQQAHKKQTQDQLEQSIQRLDDMLMRRQIVNQQKASRITQQENQSESTHRSLINPMSDPISLHKQVLQLAQNLSRYEGQPQDPSIGYGAKLRMKKKSLEKENKTSEQKRRLHSQKRQTQIELSQSQDVNYSQLNSIQVKSKVSKGSSKVSKPPQLQYSQQGSVNIPPGYNESGLLDDEDQLQDSIEKGKIQVNQRLRKMLLE